MAKQRTTFRQADVTRVVRGAQAAGLEVLRVDVDFVAGKVAIFTGSEAADPPTAFDEWKTRHAG